MTPTEFEQLRDEIGSDPGDDTLEEWYATLGHWLPVAIRALKRRLADATAGGQEVSSFTLTGVMAVGMSKASLKDLAAHIERLEARWAALNGETVTAGITVTPIVRLDRAR